MASKEKTVNPGVIALNIIKVHGKPAFRKLISMFDEGVSGAEIGRIFEVSRQRVNQWKNALGVEKISYAPHPDVKKYLKGSGTGNRVEV